MVTAMLTPVPLQRRAEKEGAAVIPATVLVFRDQHKRQVDKYAIVQQTLWTFALQHREDSSCAACPWAERREG